MSEMLFVGIDVSARELAVAWRLPGKTEPSDRKFPNTASGHRELVAFLTRHGLPVRACAEWTGTYTLDLALALAGAPNVEVMVVNPRVSSRFGEVRTRAKTDRIDARGLLSFGASMDFVPWTPPRPVVLELRALTRRIHDVTVSRTREKNRLAAAEATRTTPRSVREDIEDAIATLDRRLERLSAEALRLARSDVELAVDVENLASIRGIGETTAVVTVAELAVLPQDLRPEQVVAFAGLDPRTRESGTSVRGRGGVTKRGNARLRAALFLPAMATTRFEPAVHEFYERLVARNKPKKVVLVAVMRRLVAVMWQMMRTKERFDGDRFRPKQRAAA